MARGVSEEIDFHRSDAKLKFLISSSPDACLRRRVFYPAVIKSIICLYISSPHLALSHCHSHGSRSMFGQQLRKVLKADGDTRCVVGTMAQISDLKNKAASDQDDFLYIGSDEKASKRRYRVYSKNNVHM